jgi:hypothetical protein
LYAELYISKLLEVLCGVSLLFRPDLFSIIACELNTSARHLNNSCSYLFHGDAIPHFSEIALEAVLSSIPLIQSAFSILNPLLCTLLQDEPYFFNRVEIRALIRMNDHRNPVSM